MSIIALLSQGNWIPANKTLIKKYNTDIAILIGYLCNKQDSFNGEWFFCTYAKIEEDTGIKEYTIRKSMQALIKSSVLLSKRVGVPSKVYYQIEENELINLFNNDLGLALKKTTGLALKKTTGLFNRDSKENKEKENNKKKKLKRGRKKVKNTLPDFYLQFAFFTNEFHTLWFDEYLPLKKRKKGSTTEKTLERQLKKIAKFSNNNYEVALEILTKSIDAGWTDFYALKTSYNNSNLTGSRNSSAQKEGYSDGVEIYN